MYRQSLIAYLYMYVALPHGANSQPLPDPRIAVKSGASYGKRSWTESREQMALVNERRPLVQVGRRCEAVVAVGMDEPVFHLALCSMVSADLPAPSKACFQLNIMLAVKNGFSRSLTPTVSSPASSCRYL